MARPGRLPLMVVVSNASQLSPERFLRLKHAGMDQLSISIDFPDDRHSEFRRIPGLFDRMARVIPECARLADEGGVVLNCCITSWNFRSAPDIVRLAEQWGVSVNFSAYTPLRTDDTRGLVHDEAMQRELRARIRGARGAQARRQAGVHRRATALALLRLPVRRRVSQLPGGEQVSRHQSRRPPHARAPWSWPTTTTTGPCSASSPAATPAPAATSAPGRPPRRRRASSSRDNVAILSRVLPWNWERARGA